MLKFNRINSIQYLISALLFCLIAFDVFIWGSTPRRYYFPLALPVLYFGFYVFQYYLTKNHYQNITKYIQKGLQKMDKTGTEQNKCCGSLFCGQRRIRL